VSAEVIRLPIAWKPVLAIESGTVSGGNHWPNGTKIFWLTLKWAESGEAIVWDGTSYRDAVRAASEFLQEGVVIRDRTGGAR
jgi:hypothetical protein